MKLPENIIDADIIRLIKQGNKEVFERIFEEYSPKIYHFSLSYLNNTVEAEELVQDVFLKLWDKRETLDHTKNLKAYIYKVAINTIYDVLRRRNVENAFKDFANSSYETSSDNTWHTIIYEEMQAKLDLLVNQFPEQRKKIYKLSKEKGLSNDEIALKLKISKRTVENQLYRAISFLKQHFKEESLAALFFIYLFH
ncbi:MAG: RNA polymerase sigma-70 factor [Bacteroides sp.]|nr:RNA polymerase sigma-70 factor [Bacteroides sp.]